MAKRDDDVHWSVSSEERVQRGNNRVGLTEKETPHLVYDVDDGEMINPKGRRVAGAVCTSPGTPSPRYRRGDGFIWLRFFYIYFPLLFVRMKV